MIQQRSVATSIILTIITCGIYGIYWMVVLNDETNILSGRQQDTSGGMVVLFTIITCGIYGIYWAYKMGEKLDTTAVSKGQPAQSRSIVYLVLALCGFSVIAYALMQDSLNKLA